MSFRAFVFTTIVVYIFIFASVNASSQQLLPPSDQENLERIHRLKEILEAEKDESIKAQAECALLAIEGATALPSKCEKWAGRRSTRAARRKRAKRIVNGVTTSRYPSSGALIKGLSSKSARIQCSGTIIGCNKFLTAAHCIEDNLNPDAYWVYLQHSGIYKISKIEWPEAQYKLKDDEADLAILTLSNPVKGVQPTQINDEAAVTEGIDGTIIGFGRTGGTYKGGGKEDYGIKRAGYVKTSACKSPLEPGKHICWNFNNVLAGVELRSNTCNADSGGGLIYEDGVNLVMGVTTAGERRNCDINDHSWDVNVYQWRDWIKRRLPKRENAASCSKNEVLNLNRHVVGETINISEDAPRLVYTIEIQSETKRLSVAMNGEDDGTGANDFDLYLIRGSNKNESDAICKEDGLGQFAYCEVLNPDPGQWNIVLKKKRGEGLAQITVTRIR